MSDNAENVPSKKATLESLEYLQRLFWPLCNNVIQEHLLGIHRFVAHAHNDGCSCEPKGQAFHERGCNRFDESVTTIKEI